jgi:hypothetical protein
MSHIISFVRLTAINTGTSGAGISPPTLDLSAASPYKAARLTAMNLAGRALYILSGIARCTWHSAHAYRFLTSLSFHPKIRELLFVPTNRAKLMKLQKVNFPVTLSFPDLIGESSPARAGFNKFWKPDPSSRT